MRHKVQDHIESLEVLEMFSVLGFPAGPVVNNPPANVADTVPIPDLGGSLRPQSS